MTGSSASGMMLWSNLANAVPWRPLPNTPSGAPCEMHVRVMHWDVVLILDAEVCCWCVLVVRRDDTSECFLL